ncbi:hypothetical protein OKE68_08125 [Riemerella anatipestifer]|uniref:Uncharacterized protein n=1 Tax=Riemerella anatipestifer TaxID=34085 RepID=A0AAP3EUD3_RIEAN|nr:hypothetical protein [Riemerella anatipestifer]MBT0573650.1 hypothetical protein [Riemerella anatipestifer]MCQ4154547.1 hypothetical protein [Riemerella anatipestifer]MCQ4180540.1 hypothetical protein [Riemerella anatipestifer]MCU7567471.1 hypothetical protein [Riemerella anatipestifer]MCW0490748.1 hypothetical protein [Riemerella anatipestifer]
MAITSNFTDVLLPLVNDIKSEADFSKLLFEKVFLSRDFEKNHKIVTGVKQGNLVPILKDVPNYESFPFVDANSCDTTECSLNHQYSGEKWELGLIECRIPICLRSFDDNFLAFWNQYKMINPTENATNDYLKTALLQFLTNQVKNNLNASRWRVAWFADKSSDSKFFNGFNGFFTRMEATPNHIVRIAKNNESTYSAQKMTGKEIYDTLCEMEEKREDLGLDEEENTTIKMGKRNAKILARYLNNLKDKQCCQGMEIINPDAIQTKSFRFDNMAFHGTKIEPVAEWDEIIEKTSELNGGGGNNARMKPNRIVWGEDSNFLVGTQNREDLDMFDIWYDRTDRKVYIEAGAYLGASISLKNYVLAI